MTDLARVDHLSEPRRVLVTGGAAGLGAAVVTVLARHGWRPVVLDVRAPGVEVPFVEVDLADGRAAEGAVTEAIEAHGPLHALVTCAGIDACGPLEAVGAEAWERVVAVNLIGTAAVVRAALPSLRATHGRIVTVASTLGWRAVADATAYCASKFGVVGFTRALAHELGDEVPVTLLLPGGMATGFFDGRDPQYRPGPDTRLAQPEVVAESVRFVLEQPDGHVVRELAVSRATEGSWP